MLIIFMSGVILLAVAIAALAVSYWCWGRGFLGRCVLVAGLVCVALEAHAKLYPQPLIKQQYAREILALNT
jgi:hypothetical protein